MELLRKHGISSSLVYMSYLDLAHQTDLLERGPSDLLFEYKENGVEIEKIRTHVSPKNYNNKFSIIKNKFNIKINVDDELNLVRINQESYTITDDYKETNLQSHQHTAHYCIVEFKVDNGLLIQTTVSHIIGTNDELVRPFSIEEIEKKTDCILNQRYYEIPKGFKLSDGISDNVKIIEQTPKINTKK